MIARSEAAMSIQDLGMGNVQTYNCSNTNTTGFTIETVNGALDKLRWKCDKCGYEGVSIQCGCIRSLFADALGVRYRWLS